MSLRFIACGQIVRGAIDEADNKRISDRKVEITGFLLNDSDLLDVERIISKKARTKLCRDFLFRLVISNYFQSFLLRR